MVSKFKQGKNKENLLKKKCPLNNLLRKSIKQKLSKLVKKQKSYDGKTEIIFYEKIRLYFAFYRNKEGKKNFIKLNNTNKMFFNFTL